MSKQRKIKQRQNSRQSLARVGPNVWAPGNGGTEYKSYFSSASNIQLYHNTGILFGNVANLLSGISLGTNISNRIGVRIFVKDLELNMVLNNKTDRQNVSYRVLVVAHPATTSTDTFGELVLGGIFTGPHIPQNSMLLHDYTFPGNQGSTMSAAARERSFTHTVKLTIDKPVAYNTTDQSCSTVISAYVVTFDAYATLSTDNIASIAQCGWRIGFTDC